MLSLFDKRVYAFRATWTTAFFYSRFYSAVAISFRIYLVFSQIFVFREIVSFFLLPRNFSKRCRRFTLHANSRSTRVKPVQPPGENMSTRREDKVLFSVFFFCFYLEYLTRLVKWSNLESTMTAITARKK